MTTEFPNSLQVDVGRLEYNDETFRHVKKNSSFSRVPLLNVLWAEVDNNGTIIITTLAPSSGKLVFHPIEVELRKPKAKAKKEGEKEAKTILNEAQNWTETLLAAAYKGLKREKKFHVLINPIGGKGKASTIYERDVRPIFKAARCEADVTVTERAGHMLELAQEIDLDCDAIIILSGDGGIHEVINGLAKHPNARKALRIPLAQIPTGSANALCVNLLGPKDAFSIEKACLNAIKGRPIKQNIYSIKQGDKQYLSFLSQAAGLMADLDLGTEHLRWMGDGRFMVGYMRGVISKKLCPVEIEYKLVESNKIEMATTAKSKFKDTHFYNDEDDEMEDVAQSLPWEVNGESSSSEEWTKFENPVMYLYAGGLPYVGRDLMQFPAASPSDGCIDLVIQSKATRSTMIKAAVGAEKGDQYWLDCQYYFKVTSYRFKPLGQGNLSIDGEVYPFEPFELQVHPGILRLLTLDGRYIADAFEPGAAILKATQ
ncbi:sphinganine kinase lcb4 [Serendipita sp. 396]|nr:sphinganine kinase lcb4 [Serendipita sp. 396]KAG8782467.1 sphinganine kinase lcb4 [Serendipita sp. 397]KAG8821998.1 sphinganine kinase lcb4 [Serendipita sp. 401]KAG8866883.1 sphinganine kinase lcb4 [Serendipita sp. 405]